MKCSLWIHDYEIFYEFIRWIQTQIYDHEDSLKKIVKLCQNSYVWNCLKIQDAEIMCSISYMNSYNEFVYEFSAMKNIVKSWLNSYKWIHIWNDGWTFYS